MLYQAAVILTYPVMLERALTPSALRGPAGGLEWGHGGVWGGTSEEVALLKPQQPLSLTHPGLGGS